MQLDFSCYVSEVPYTYGIKKMQKFSFPPAIHVLAEVDILLHKIYMRMHVHTHAHV